MKKAYKQKRQNIVHYSSESSFQLSKYSEVRNVMITRKYFKVANKGTLKIYLKTS